MSDLRKALVLQVSDSEREELETFCQKYDISSDKLLIALLNGLKSGKVSLGSDEEGDWIVFGKGQHQEQTYQTDQTEQYDFEQYDTEPEQQEPELIKEWNLTYNTQTKQEPKEVPYDLVNLLALAESGYDLGVKYIDLKSIYDSNDDYEEEFEEATDKLYGLAKKILHAQY